MLKCFHVIKVILERVSPLGSHTETCMGSYFEGEEEELLYCHLEHAIVSAH